jgi:hypothetical protein
VTSRIIGMPLSQARKDSLDSWQYKAATLILRRKLNIPKAAILLELGWESLSVFIDRQRKTWLIKTNRNQVISVKMFDFQFHLKKLLLTNFYILIGNSKYVM